MRLRGSSTSGPSALYRSSLHISCNYRRKISWYDFHNLTDKQSQSFGCRWKLYAYNLDTLLNNPRGHLRYFPILSDIQPVIFNSLPHNDNNHLKIKDLEGDVPLRIEWPGARIHQIEQRMLRADTLTDRMASPMIAGKQMPGKCKSQKIKIISK